MAVNAKMDPVLIDNVNLVVAKLQSAKRPVILAGTGIRLAKAEEK